MTAIELFLEMTSKFCFCSRRMLFISFSRILKSCVSRSNFNKNNFYCLPQTSFSKTVFFVLLNFFFFSYVCMSVKQFNATAQICAKVLAVLPTIAVVLLTHMWKQGKRHKLSWNYYGNNFELSDPLKWYQEFPAVYGPHIVNCCSNIQQNI